MTRGVDNSGIGSAVGAVWTGQMDQAVKDLSQAVRDIEKRVTPDALWDALVRLAQHSADGCPPPLHRQAGLGLCRHKTWRITGWTGQAPNTQPIRVKELCGQPTPCPDHPQDVELNDVEAEAIRQMETTHRIIELARYAQSVRMATAGLIGAVEASKRLTAASGGSGSAVECCGGWDLAKEPAHKAGSVRHRHVKINGAQVPMNICDRCFERCRKAEYRSA